MASWRGKLDIDYPNLTIFVSIFGTRVPCAPADLRGGGEASRELQGGGAKWAEELPQVPTNLPTYFPPSLPPLLPVCLLPLPLPFFPPSLLQEWPQSPSLGRQKRSENCQGRLGASRGAQWKFVRMACPVCSGVRCLFKCGSDQPPGTQILQNESDIGASSCRQGGVDAEVKKKKKVGQSPPARLAGASAPPEHRNLPIPGRAQRSSGWQPSPPRSLPQEDTGRGAGVRSLPLATKERVGAGAGWALRRRRGAENVAWNLWYRHLLLHPWEERAAVSCCSPGRPPSRCLSPHTLLVPSRITQAGAPVIWGWTLFLPLKLLPLLWAQCIFILRNKLLVSLTPAPHPQTDALLCPVQASQPGT